jgi:glucosylceramidase
MTVTIRPRASALLLTLLAILPLGSPGDLAAASAHGHRHPVRHRRAHGASSRRKPRAAAVIAVQTNRSLSQALLPVGVLEFAAASRALPVIHVDDTRRYQALTGYGAAMTDTSAWLLYEELSPAVRDRVMSGLFSADGVRINFVRVPMGGSDFTVGEQGYSYDDLPARRTDPTLADFTIGHDMPYIIPALRQMLLVDPNVELLANPWSPPPWMKENDAFGDQANNGHAWAQLLPGMEGPLAAYFVKFIQAYAAQGVHITDVTPENEPLAWAAYPSLQIPAAQEADFLQNHLVPALQAAGLHLAIWGGDGANLAYNTSLEQSTAAGFLAGIAWHCYSASNPMMGFFHTAYPRVPEIVSECSPGINPYSVSELFIDATRNWASKIQLWNLALDVAGGPVQPPNRGCSGCTALVQVNEATHTARYTANYYQFGQISKFVSPGAVRIYSDRFVSDFGPSPYGVSVGVDNVAFRNPNGSHVLVAYNNSNAAQAFAVAFHGRQFSYSLPARATVTFTWH